jgi:hypothetical protein
VSEEQDKEDKEEFALLDDIRFSLGDVLKRTSETATAAGMDALDFAGVFIAMTLAMSADLAVHNGMSREWFIGKMSTVYDIFKAEHDKGKDEDE